MRAVEVIEPNRVGMVELPEPKPGPYQAKVKTEVAYLCNGTDRKLISGNFPGIHKYPVVLGHESAGVIQDLGNKVRNFKVGDRAIGGLVLDLGNPKYSSGWGGFCEYTLVNDHDAMVEDGVADVEHGWFECYESQRSVDPDIPVEAAALLCTWREVYGGFGDFNLKKGDDILVFGAGPVGLSFTKFAKLLGLGYVGVVEPVKHKREKAALLGADETFAPESPDLKALNQRRGKAIDAVIDAVGNEDIINAGLPLIKMGGSICVYGVIANDSIKVQKRKGPYNFNLYVHQWPTRLRERAAQGPLCTWIREGKINAAEFVTHEFPVEQIKDAVHAIDLGNAVKVILRF